MIISSISAHKMHKKNLFICVAIVIASTLLIDQADARKDGVQHCNDKMRELILDSCKNLNAAYKQRRNSRQIHSPIVKRENNDVTELDEDDFEVQFLENETTEDFPKGHRLFNVRRSTFPDSAYLILTHPNAKVLRQYDPKYKINPRPAIYRNVNGQMVRDVPNRHKRNSHRGELFEKIAGCCNNDQRCRLALCTARP